nr:reverse transcriptase domain-containing protein [Tanacetum cinerariifolium]
MHRANPRTIRDGINQSYVKEFNDLLFDNIMDFRIYSSLMLDCRFKVLFHKNFVVKRAVFSTTLKSFAIMTGNLSSPSKNAYSRTVIRAVFSSTLKSFAIITSNLSSPCKNTYSMWGGWRVCIDYHKLNEATRKDHFPLPFMDQMLERLAGNQYYCFLDRFCGYFQIPIDPKDQEKTKFTCPYRMFAYRLMPFRLCNAPGMFQKCMMAMFHDMIEKTIKVFMGDFSVFENSFQSCLYHLERMLKRCEDTNLCLKWEKSHFMVKEGIVLGHKISKQGIEVDKAKVNVITKLPPPTTVKGIRRFLGHADFYRRFI